jgi:hypothetical protein
MTYTLLRQLKMNNRQLAIQELFEGLTTKYGSHPTTKKIISSEIQRFSSSKTKISVDDIDKLESEIRKLCGISKSVNFRNKECVSCLNTFKPINENFNTSPIKKFPSDLDPLITTKSPYVLPYKPGKKQVDRIPDHFLFPTESSPYNLNFTTSVDSRDLSYSKSNLNSYDD